LRLAERLGPDATVVTVMCDTGMKYLSKKEFESLG
jgi:cysteine synthase A